MILPLFTMTFQTNAAQAILAMLTASALKARHLPPRQHQICSLTDAI